MSDFVVRDLRAGYGGESVIDGLSFLLWGALQVW